MYPTSIIIPTYNEGDQILVLLKSINFHFQEFLPDFEIIIINNGSNDISSECAYKFHAKTYFIEKTNVGAARNYGVSKSNNDLLVFLDADTEITDSWAKEIQKVAESLHKDFNQITGNKVSIPDNPNWIEKYWFCEIPNQKINYINSANLIISKKLFLKLNGFDENLISGEDYDLSIRAIKSGATLSVNSKLKIIHHGYPQNILNFIKREIWHGTGDFISIESILKSKVAIATLAFIFIHLLLIISFFSQKPFVIFILILLFSFNLLLSWKKYSLMSTQYKLVNTTIYYLYFFGRSLSFFKVILNSLINKQ